MLNSLLSRPGRWPAWPHLAAALLAPPAAVALVTALGFGISDVVTLRSISVLYLAGVVGAAVTGGRAAAIAAALLSFLAYDYCFIEPRYTFSIAQPDEVVALMIFVGVALALGTLTAQRGEAAATARRQAATTVGLLAFSAELATAYELGAVQAATTSRLHRTLGRPAVLLVAADSGPEVVAAAPATTTLTREDQQAAEAAASRRAPSGATTAFVPEAKLQFVPVVLGHRLLGVVGLAGAPLGVEENEVLGGLLQQSAIAMDRALRARDTVAVALSRESETLQAALLNSLSHDFRTPLASITGAASSLRELGSRMDAATRDDLLASIEQDAGQLNRFVGNLLDMTRLQAGRLAARRGVLDLAEVVERAVARVQAIDPTLQIRISLAPDLPNAEGDALLLEQALFNILDNARKYAGEAGPVSVYSRGDADAVIVAVSDRGDGIAASDLERIFDRFYRRGGADGRGPGTGLGLSIARGFVEAMGGTLIAESPAQQRRGTRFVFRLRVAGRS